jgi:hypothetical protein
VSLGPEVTHYTIDRDDLSAIAPCAFGEEGYLAACLLGPRPEWLLINSKDIETRGGTSCGAGLLRALRDGPFSAKCVEEYRAILSTHSADLSSFRYSSLVRWAKIGRSL